MIGLPYDLRSKASLGNCGNVCAGILATGFLFAAGEEAILWNVESPRRDVCSTRAEGRGQDCKYSG